MDLEEYKNIIQYFKDKFYHLRGQPLFEKRIFLIQRRPSLYIGLEFVSNYERRMKKNHSDSSPEVVTFLDESDSKFFPVNYKWVGNDLYPNFTEINTEEFLSLLKNEHKKKFLYNLNLFQ